ncbi:protein LIKE COV 1-like [Vigna umbellata]|uniref:protein LIKE COV 1-like n=1 Tax=Vigna umbellata TaxID=87088 RepID=UPI001F5E72C6|nr:protein LIKE COV 1-like [Vigna umbellata]
MASRDLELLIPVSNLSENGSKSSTTSPNVSSTHNHTGQEAFLKVIRSWASKKFMSGCVILLPIAITFYVTWGFIRFVDGFFSPIYNHLGINIFGLGFITSITFIFLVGIFMSSWLGISLLTLGEWFIKKMPLVSYIYVASKQISVAISPDQSSNAFKEVAIIRHPRVGEYAIGFITSSVILRNRDDDELFCVYVPTNHLYLGDIYLISPNDILRPNLSVREGIEIVISGGMSIPKILTIVDAHTNFAPRKATYASKRSDLLAIKDCVPCCCDQEENSVEFFDLEYDISKGDRNRVFFLGCYS